MKSARHLTGIKETLRLVCKSRRSSFYRKKYDILPQVRSFEDFENVPLLTREELVSTNAFDRLYVPKEEIRRISISSGTTGGTKPLVTFAVGYNKDIRNSYRKIFKRLGINRLLNLFPSPNLSSNFAKYLSLDYPISITGDIRNLTYTVALASAAKIDAIRTTPTILDRFLSELEREYDLKNLKWVELGNEFCTKETYKAIQKKLPGAVIRFTYGTSETSLGAVGCEHLLRSGPEFFHPLKRFYFEIVNPENGQALENGSEGEIVITTLFEAPTPLVRYKTGDLGIITQKKCKCKETITLEVKGRASFDSLRIKGVLFDAQKIQEAVQYASDYIEKDFCLHVYEKSVGKQAKLFLTIEIVPKKGGKISPFFEKTVADILAKNLYITPKLTLSDYIKKEIFLPLEVKQVKEFPNISQKKRYIISHLG